MNSKLVIIITFILCNLCDGRFSNILPPEGIHMSLGGDPFTERSLIWTSRTNVIHNITLEATSTHQVRTVRVENIPLYAAGDVRFVQRTRISNLIQNERYRYTVDKKSFIFRTWMHNRPMQFLFYGSITDVSGNRPAGHVEIIKKLNLGNFAAAVNLGSLGCQKNLHRFLEDLQEIAGRTAYLTTPGRGEIKDDFRLYSQLFSMPNVPWPMERYWYSFDTEMAHIISFSTEPYFKSDFGQREKQEAWLEKDLKKANDAQVRHHRGRPWIIAFSHRPLYCSGDVDCSHESIRLKSLEKLFFKYGVDLIITSQENFYERTYPVNEGKVIHKTYTNPYGPVYITTGAFSCNKLKRNRGNKKPEWSALRVALYGDSTYGVLNIFNRTMLQWTEYDADNHRVLDDFKMSQNFHGPFFNHHEYHPVVIVVTCFVAAFVLALSVLILLRRRVVAYFQKKKAEKAMSYTTLQTGAVDL